MSYQAQFEIVPYEEESPQVGREGYERDAKHVAELLISQLKRTFNTEGVSFEISENSHDFGKYHSITAKVDQSDACAVNRLNAIEDGFPAYWDSESALNISKN